MRDRDRHTEASEADIVEQTIPADPSDTEEFVQPLGEAPEPVSEADWIDQQIPVPVDEDDATAEET